MQIDGDEDAEGLVGWGFVKILYGHYWDGEIRNKAKDIARWMTDNVDTEEERAVIRKAGLSGYE